MRLGKFTAGYIVTTGIAATVFILVVKWAGGRFPHVPVIGSVARSI